jgi:hypothetical protein
LKEFEKSNRCNHGWKRKENVSQGATGAIWTYLQEVQDAFLNFSTYLSDLGGVVFESIFGTI